jgi:hypothetical protein
MMLPVLKSTWKALILIFSPLCNVQVSSILATFAHIKNLIRICVFKKCNFKLIIVGAS